MRAAEVYMHGIKAGVLQEADQGYLFTYDAAYLQCKDAMAISLSMPLREDAD